jgi:hydroxymethylpyrimidine pyrophosphatase-like HAD family hydrolase
LKKFLFVDLDDTLFQTPKKCREQTDLRPAAYIKDGSVCSYTTAAQRAFLDLARREMTLIPATARNHDALRRVDVTFTSAFTSYAILDYGGVILEPGGTPDADWLHRMQAQMALALPGLRHIMQHIDDYQKTIGHTGRARLVEDYATPFYALIKDPDGQADNLARIEQEIVAPWVATEGADYFIHRNGNNLAILPKMLNKAHAVAHLHQRFKAEYGDIISFGMGDSRSDARFMAACDYAIIPNGTQLAGLTTEAL